MIEQGICLAKIIKRIGEKKKNRMRVLSLFDGISCGMVALERAGIPVERYVAYEIEESAIEISKKNYPQIEHCGDVTTADFTQYEGFDILIGGSPCQDISNMNKKQKGLDGEKSGLFYHYLRALKEVKPKYFLLENVVGKKEAINAISEMVGVEPILIDSKLVSAQRRKRYYWTNIPNIAQPQDRKILMQDVLQNWEEAEDGYLTEGRLRWLLSEKGQKTVQKRYANINGEKCQCLTARSEPSWNCQYIFENGKYRHLTPVEYERMQTLPDNYTFGVHNRERYKALGNGWTVDVIAHIFTYLKEQENETW